MSFQVLHLPGPFADAGYIYGQACRTMLHEGFEPYVESLIAITKVSRETLASASLLWASRLPLHYQEQMHAMAEGARVGFDRLAQFLYADISAQGRIGVHQFEPGPGLGVDASGPMCSSVLAHHAEGSWVARNCDWYHATLVRGTCAVVHEPPGRIPSMALGIMGDLDCDTGINAERLWLHMHTLLAFDEPRAGVSCISWLFWMREALETCSTLDDVERFIARTDRDRGVILLACDGKARRGRGEVAIFECTRSTSRRIGLDSAEARYGEGRFLVATNHCQTKHPSPEQWRARPPGLGRGSTVARCQRLREIMVHAPPEHVPDDLIEILADDQVEMRDAGALRTIYSAVACPSALPHRTPRIWFASGESPAASRGTWHEVAYPW